MAKKPSKTEIKPSATYTKWAERISKAEKDYSEFCNRGDTIVGRYRLEERRATNTNNRYYRDKYNILYSSTETMRPSLYARTPKPEVNPRHKDSTDDNTNLASMLLENCLDYAIEETEIDSVMKNVVGDFLLPGMGIAWVNYRASITEVNLNEDKPDAEPDMYSYTEWENLELEYVHYKDFLTSGGRTWKDIWWVAKRTYLFKEEAVERFGKEKAATLDYSYVQEDSSDKRGKISPHSDIEQAIVWEIWDKRNKEVIWWSEGTKDVLDQKPDPLKLKDFFPCPEPVRAVTTTDMFIPCSFFSQYREQAETLDDITARIRVLTKALRLVGMFDASQDSLRNLLTGTDNKMVPVDNWTQFATTGGMDGSVQFLPIKEVATVLLELYQQREIAKNEIYEITGFSDIVRGVSKASETLGAQQIKNEWAGGRLKMLQKEIQRFCRDIVRIMAEIIAEQFDEETIKLYSGFTPPPITPEEQQAIAQATQAAVQGMPVQPPPTRRSQMEQQFSKVVETLRKESVRCAKIDIETDSTIQPDEAAERKDRMDFLGAMGAFLQQAGPMAMQYPDMRGLLGAMMMFTARTFRASRPIEKEFEQFTRQLQAQPPQDPNNNQEGGDKGESALQTAQIKAQSDQATTQMKVQADQQEAARKMELEKYKADLDAQAERYKIDKEAELKAREIALREREVAVKEAELGLKREDMAHDHQMDEEQAEREDERLDIEARNRQQSEQSEGNGNG